MRSIPPAIASSRTLTGITAGLVLAALLSGGLEIEWLASIVKVALAAIIIGALAPLARKNNR